MEVPMGQNSLILALACACPPLLVWCTMNALGQRAQRNAAMVQICQQYIGQKFGSLAENGVITCDALLNAIEFSPELNGEILMFVLEHISVFGHATGEEDFISSGGFPGAMPVIVQVYVIGQED